MAAEKDLVIAEGGSKKKFIIIGAAVLLVVLAAPVMQFCLDAALQLQANDVNGGPA